MSQTSRRGRAAAGTRAVGSTVALIGCVLTAGIARAQAIPAGTIVFAHEESGSSDPAQQFSNVWALNPQNPAQAAPLTSFNAPPIFAATPVWTRDFSGIAFTSNVNNGLASLEADSIYRITPDGSNLAQITGFGVLGALPPPAGTIVGHVKAPPSQAGNATVSACVVSVQGAPQNATCGDDDGQGLPFAISGVPVGAAWVRVQAQVSYELTLGQPGLSLGFTNITVVPGDVSDAGTVVVFPSIPKSIEPAWSPDATQVIATNEVSAKTLQPNPITGQLEWDPTISHQLSVWSANGQFVGAVPNPTGLEAFGSDWSPIGNQICFAAGGSSAGQSYVMVANPDGSNAQVLYQVPIDFVALHFVTYCRWSPDGSTIAVVQVNEPTFGSGSSDLYLVNADRSGVRQMTANGAGGNLLVPAWSPDGTAIAFQFSIGADPLSFTSSDLWVIGVDGSCCARLTTDGRSTGPSWGPPQ